MNSEQARLAIEALAKEKNIDIEGIYEAIELALATPYKKMYKKNVRVELNRKDFSIKVFTYVTVIPEPDDSDDEWTYNPEKEILYLDAIEKVPNINVGETIEELVEPEDLNRVSAGVAKQVIMQKIREAERDSVYQEYKDKEGELIIGLVSMEDENNYLIDINRTTAMLPKKELIPGETIEMGSQIKAYVFKVENTTKGASILLSRKHVNFLKRLLELEIPELKENLIMLYNVAREAGVRSKIAVYSMSERIDAVGTCIGEGGIRINQISKELNGEKIDVILYEKDEADFIKNSLSPAKNLIVVIPDIKEKVATVIADKDNFSLAIGKKGINVKLTAMLTKFKLDIKSRDDMLSEGISIKEE